MSALFIDTSACWMSLQLAGAHHAANVLGELVTFISSDCDLLAAAGADGLLSENPLDHP